jgi:imidazole glycerol phosphate synthase subunit HisF
VGIGPARWEVYSHGGRTPEGLDALAWCRRVAELGAREILLTSMDRDGTGTGYDTALLAEVASAVTIAALVVLAVVADLALGTGAPSSAAQAMRSRSRCR